MSSFWDSLGAKIQANAAMLQEIQKLCAFLKEMDEANQKMLSTYLNQRNFTNGYLFVDFDRLFQDIQSQNITNSGLLSIVQDLHSFDHTIDQCIMYTYEINPHYWATHKQYRNSMGLLKNGVWNKTKVNVGFRR